MCVAVYVGYMHASFRSMCAGTSTWRPCQTGPQCVRPDAKSTWQKQIMSAPVIFSSPSALQEPFKGPNTDEITYTNLWIYHACIQYGRTHPLVIHILRYTGAPCKQHFQNYASTRCKEKTQISNVTFLKGIDISMSSCTNPLSETLTCAQNKTCIQSNLFPPLRFGFASLG